MRFAARLAAPLAGSGSRPREGGLPNGERFPAGLVARRTPLRFSLRSTCHLSSRKSSKQLRRSWTPSASDSTSRSLLIPRFGSAGQRISSMRPTRPTISHQPCSRRAKRVYPTSSLGLGANVLIGDRGFRGLVIRNTARDTSSAKSGGHLPAVDRERRDRQEAHSGVGGSRLVGARALRRHSEHGRRSHLAEPAFPVAGARARAHDVHRRSVRVVRHPHRGERAKDGRCGLREVRLRRYGVSSPRRHRAHGDVQAGARRPERSAADHAGESELARQQASVARVASERRIDLQEDRRASAPAGSSISAGSRAFASATRRSRTCTPTSWSTSATRRPRTFER